MTSKCVPLPQWTSFMMQMNQDFASKKAEIIAENGAEGVGGGAISVPSTPMKRKADSSTPTPSRPPPAQRPSATTTANGSTNGVSTNGGGSRAVSQAPSAQQTKPIVNGIHTKPQPSPSPVARPCNTHYQYHPRLPCLIPHRHTLPFFQTTNPPTHAPILSAR